MKSALARHRQKQNRKKCLVGIFYIMSFSVLMMGMSLCLIKPPVVNESHVLGNQLASQDTGQETILSGVVLVAAERNYALIAREP